MSSASRRGIFLGKRVAGPIANDAEWVAGIRIKIERAVEHIDYLSSKIRAFLDGEPKPFVLVTHRDEERGLSSLVASEVSNPDPRLGSIAADAIHNLRTALEIMWKSSIEPSAGRGSDFPFCDGSKPFESRQKGPESRRLHAAMCAVGDIYENKGRMKQLHMLMLADDSDKHRAIMSAVAANRYFAKSKRIPGGVELDFGTRSEPICPITKGTPFLGPLPHAEFDREMDMEPYFPTCVSFTNVLGFDGERLLDGQDMEVSIYGWHRVVLDTVDAFRDRGLLGAHWPPPAP